MPARGKSEEERERGQEPNAKGASAQRLISLSFPRMMILDVCMWTTVVCDQTRDEGTATATATATKLTDRNAKQTRVRDECKSSCQERQANLLS